MKLPDGSVHWQIVSGYEDWVTHCPDDNWIVPFVSVVDLRDKMRVWVRALAEKVSLPVRPAAQAAPPRKLAVLVEGRVDETVVRVLLGKIVPDIRGDIVRVGGSLAALSRVKDALCSYAAIYDDVAILGDLDDVSASTANFRRSKYDDFLRELGLRNVTFYFAVPVIESWIAALRADLFPDVKSPDDTPDIKRRVAASGLRVHALLEHADITQGEARSPSLASFVKYLWQLKLTTGSGAAPNTEASILATARDAVRDARDKGAVGEVEADVALDGEAEVEAARCLAANGQGRVELRGTGWVFVLTDTPP